MQYKEMLEKTVVMVVGICKGLNEYISDKQKSYWSVDLEIKGTKMPVNIRLPENFNRQAFKEYELVKVSCVIKPTFDRKGIMLEAVAAAGA